MSIIELRFQFIVVRLLLVIARALYKSDDKFWQSNVAQDGSRFVSECERELKQFNDSVAKAKCGNSSSTP